MFEFTPRDLIRISWIIEKNECSGLYLIPRSEDFEMRREFTGEFLGIVNFRREPRGVTFTGYEVLVVLTISHLDQTPEHNELSNLRALCQKCHLRHDLRQHGREAAHTRRQAKRNLELFDDLFE